MRETIQTLKLNRVVVAACSPRTHEGVFREVLAAAGLNPGYFAFANIREQCAWVHQTEPEAALAKALDLVAMAVSRAAVLSPIQLQSFPVIPRALVLGGGVAGLSAALTLADQGFHTYLVERESTLGAWPGSCTLPWKARTPRNLFTSSRPRFTIIPTSKSTSRPNWLNSRATWGSSGARCAASP